MKEEIIILTGNLVASYVEELEKTLVERIGEGVESLVLDFEKCSVVDSAGIGLLVKARNSLKPKGGNVSVKNLDENIRRMFEMMHLDKHITM